MPSPNAPTLGVKIPTCEFGDTYPAIALPVLGEQEESVAFSWLCSYSSIILSPFYSKIYWKDCLYSVSTSSSHHLCHFKHLTWAFPTIPPTTQSVPDV